MDKIKRFECDDGFAIESSDEDEIIEMSKMHIKTKDHQDVTDDYVKSNMHHVSMM